VSGNHGNNDYWLVKLDAMGNIEWQKCFGGSNDDEASVVRQTFDGGFIISGFTNSNDSDVTGYHGNKDYWIVKVDSTGNLQWESCYGGSAEDYPNDIKQTQDSSYIIVGRSRSNDGDVTGNPDSLASWIVKLNRSGNIMWQYAFGNYYDPTVLNYDFLEGKEILEKGPNDFQLFGDLYIIITNTHNYFGMMEFDSSGNVLSRLYYPDFYTYDWDHFYSVINTFDNGYLLFGAAETLSTGYDFYLLKLDSLMNREWDFITIGNGNDYPGSVAQSSDGGYVFTGSLCFGIPGLSCMNPFNAAIIKIGGTSVNLNEKPLADFSFWANINAEDETLALKFFMKQPGNLQLSLLDITGRTLLRQTLTATEGINKQEIQVGDLAKGIYVVRMEREGLNVSAKVVKQ
jgi:hypothetical protein